MKCEKMTIAAARASDASTRCKTAKVIARPVLITILS